MLKLIRMLPLFLIVALSNSVGAFAQYLGDKQNAGNLKPTAFSPKSSSLNQASGNPITDWFKHYDQIRRNAQMTPLERQRADILLLKGLSIIVPGEERTATQELLIKLVENYQMATEQLKQMPLFPETEKLHRGYYQYFHDGRDLFCDYLKLQNNLFAKDAAGNPLAGALLSRKQNLEMLDCANKQLDEELRQKYDISPYRY